MRVAGIFGFLGVALGAMGAHAFKLTLEANGTVEIWKTAALYHLVHAVVLLALALWARGGKLAPWFFSLGICIFSGSLYTLALTNIRWLGAVTPIGGLLLMAGWLVLVLQKPVKA